MDDRTIDVRDLINSNSIDDDYESFCGMEKYNLISQF